jgi:hypothetical protein
MIVFHPAFDRIWYLEINSRVLEAKSLRELTEKVCKKLGHGDFKFIGYDPNGYNAPAFTGSVVADHMRVGRLDPRQRHFVTKANKRTDLVRRWNSSRVTRAR